MCYIFAIITLDLTCSNRFSKVNFLWHFVALSFLYKMYIPWPLPPTSGSPGKLSGDDKRRTRSTIRNHKAPRWGALIYASDCLQEGILIKENPAPPENIEKLDIYEIQENYNLLWKTLSFDTNTNTNKKQKNLTQILVCKRDIMERPVQAAKRELSLCPALTLLAPTSN